MFFRLWTCLLSASLLPCRQSLYAGSPKSFWTLTGMGRPQVRVWIHNLSALCSNFVASGVLYAYTDVIVLCGIGIKLLDANDLRTWYLSIEVLGDTVYEVRSIITERIALRERRNFTHRLWQGEKFLLMFRFEDDYPISSPAVQFVVNQEYQAPIHPVRL